MVIKVNEDFKRLLKDRIIERMKLELKSEEEIPAVIPHDTHMEPIKKECDECGKDCCDETSYGCLECYAELLSRQHEHRPIPHDHVH